jgi:hypothetical protein
MLSSAKLPHASDVPRALHAILYSQPPDNRDGRDLLVFIHPTTGSAPIAVLALSE